VTYLSLVERSKNLGAQRRDFSGEGQKAKVTPTDCPSPEIYFANFDLSTRER